MKNIICILFLSIFLTVIIILTAYENAAPPTLLDITTADSETNAYELSVNKPLVYEIEGDTTVLREFRQLMPVKMPIDIDWNSNIQEITTHHYYDVCPYFDTEPLPDTLIAHNTVDGVKLHLIKVSADNPQSPYYYAVTDVLFNDIAYHLEEPLQFVLYRMWAQVGDGIMVIGNQSYSEHSALDVPAVWYVLTETGMLRINNDVFIDGYELKFDKDEDGTVTYYYLNADFVIAQQDIFSFCNAVTSSDQFIRKSGNILAEDCTVIFEQTLYQSVNEFYRSNGFNLRSLVPPDIDTIDKFIDYVNSGSLNK